MTSKRLFIKNYQTTNVFINKKISLKKTLHIIYISTAIAEQPYQGINGVVELECISARCRLSSTTNTNSLRSFMFTRWFRWSEIKLNKKKYSVNGIIHKKRKYNDIDSFTNMLFHQRLVFFLLPHWITEPVCIN